MALSLFFIASAAFVWSLFWVVQGYAVPRAGYMISAGVLLVLLLVGYFWRRTSHEVAAHAADAHFGLKDALASFLGFKREYQDDFRRLHAEQTAEKVKALDVSSIPLVWPKRILAATFTLLIASVVLGSRDASPIVQEKLLIEEQTNSRTAEINEELEEQMEELLKNATEEEKELLRPDDWRKWIKELEQTKDRKDAMRQYAELERKLQQAAEKLSLREQEHLLNKAAEELQKEPESREIGKQLEQKNYREAARDIQKLQAKADVSKPDEARKELSRLKSAAQRMASAARQQQQRSGKQGASSKSKASASTSSSLADGKSGNPGGQGQASGQSGTPTPSSLDDQMMALDQAAQAYDQALAKNLGESQCNAARKNLNQQLAGLCNSLGKCATQRDLMKKIAALGQCASQCQGYLSNKQCNSLAQCFKSGKSGKSPGMGSSDERRNALELTQDNGNRDQLQGIKGAGPSNTTVEAADSGTGIASGQVKVAEREWQRQVESFIQREDVPAEVRDGVKEYFKGIQQVGE